MRSVSPANADAKPVVDEIIKCLRVDSAAAYMTRRDELAALTDQVQQEESNRKGLIPRCAMLVFRVLDDAGRVIPDYDLFLLGDQYHRDKLPGGFFIDRQKNQQSQALVYYLNYDKLKDVTGLGFQVVPRPMIEGESGQAADALFAGYRPAEFRIAPDAVKKYVNPNETVYIEIVLNRYVDREATRLGPLTPAPVDFKRTRPTGERLPVAPDGAGN